MEATSEAKRQSHEDGEGPQSEACDEAWYALKVIYKGASTAREKDASPHDVQVKQR